MSLSSKKVLLAVILVFVLANAFFAAYFITMKRAPDENPSLGPGNGAASVVTGEADNSAAQTTAPQTPDDREESLPTAPAVTEEAEPATTAAPETTAAPATTQASPEETVTPTYIGGILVVNKSYPLPRSYDPGGLTDECESAFYEMQAAAEEEGLDLYISSGFRSYDLQASLYRRYCNEDGQAAADTYSARPGHSEHQSGLAIDLNTITSDFSYTAEGQWVAEHCWEYWFILRYPADKVSVTGYMYEPWHIRYLGKSTASAVYHSGLCLEEYLGIDSVYKE